MGISSMTGPQIKFGLQAARVVKETGSDAEDVKGIVFKKDGQIIKTEPEAPLDLNELPEPPYHLVDVEDYVGSQGRFQGEAERSLIFISSRGCPWQCAYCCNPKLSKRRWRSMSAEKTYERAIKLVEKYNLDAITFHDEEFLVSRSRAEKIAHLIGGQFKWWIQGRMDRLKDMDLSYLEKNGLCEVQPGIESGSDRILEMIKKGETVEDMLEANRALAKTNILPLYNFMVGFPTETHEELMQTVDLALRLLDENPKAQISGFYIFVPYPGTELFDLKTPWVKDNEELFRNLIFSSKWVDGTRLQYRLKTAFRGLPIPLFFCEYLGRFYRRKWRKHIFRTCIDKIVDKLPLFLFSLSQNALVKRVAKKK